MTGDAHQIEIPARDYDLAATLTSGQAFRWRQQGASCWEGVVDGRWVRLTTSPHGLVARAALPCANWDWLGHYLQAEVDLISD